MVIGGAVVRWRIHKRKWDVGQIKLGLFNEGMANCP